MLNQAAARFEANKAAADASQPYSRTPLVNNAIRQLSSYTLADLRTATSAKLQSPWEDDKLIEHTNVILYHSVVTMVLDKAGNPFDLRYTPDRRGLLDYAVLVPEPGSQMRRALPNPGGVTVSVQRYGDTTFRIENDKISKVLFGGVGSFREVGYGYTGKHALQETVEQFLKGAGGYIASVSAEAAFNPAEADLSRINLRLYDLAEAATPHVINEMKARLKNVVENWQEILEQGVWEAIKNVVIDEIRDRIQKYVIKKIGESIVPVVNAAFALYDLATGSAARTAHALRDCLRDTGRQGHHRGRHRTRGAGGFEGRRRRVRGQDHRSAYQCRQTRRQKSGPARHGGTAERPGTPDAPPTATEATPAKPPTAQSPATAQPAPPVH